MRNNLFKDKTFYETNFLFYPGIEIIFQSCIFSWIRNSGIVISTPNKLTLDTTFFTHCGTLHSDGCIVINCSERLITNSVFFENCKGDTSLIRTFGLASPNTIQLNNTNFIEYQFTEQQKQQKDVSSQFYYLRYYSTLDFSYSNSTAPSSNTYLFFYIGNMKASLKYFYCHAKFLNTLSDADLNISDSYFNSWPFTGFQSTSSSINCFRVTFYTPLVWLMSGNITASFYNCHFIIFPQATGAVLENCSENAEYIQVKPLWYENNEIINNQILFEVKNQKLTAPLNILYRSIISISNVHFIDIMTSNKGGAISISDEILRVEVQYSTFQRCTAINGGAFYLSDINTTVLNNLCLDSCIGKSNAFFEIVNYDEFGSYSSHVSMTGDKEYMHMSDSFFSSPLPKNLYSNATICLCSIYGTDFLITKPENEFQCYYNYSLFYNCSGSNIFISYQPISFSQTVFQHIHLDLGPIAFLLCLWVDENSSSISSFSKCYFGNCTKLTALANAKISVIDCRSNGLEYVNENITEGKSPNLQFLSFHCYYFPEKRSVSPVIIIVSIVAGILFLISIIASVFFIRQKSISQKQRDKLELSKSILNDFG